MIYRVVLDDTIDIHTSDIDCMLLNPSIELEMNSAGSFKFTLPPGHPNWDDIKVLKSTIDVYENNELIFTGRVASIEKNWNNERVVDCEGALAYFNDSIHRQMKWETPLPIAIDPDDQPEDPAEHRQNFLEDILNNHNVFEGSENLNRHIYIGHIYVDTELVTREVDYNTTLDILTRMCIDTNGGYFQIRKDPEDGKLYLDWLKDFTDESSQPASFGLNLLDFNTSLNAEDICTGVLARGATVNDQVVTLTDVELVDETTYPDPYSVTHYTDRYQDILWHREGVKAFGQVVQVHDFSDAQIAWKDQGGKVVANSLFEVAKKWLEEKNTKVETIEVEVAELAWLGDGYPQYKLGQIVEIIDSVHMGGESETTRHLPMYKISCDLTSGSKKVTLGTPPKKELTQISASNSDSSTLSSTSSSGSSGGGSGSGEECKVTDVKVDGTSVVSNKVANISLTGKADVSTVNALANTVAQKADTSVVNALANTVAGKQDQIVFNTQEAATENLIRLKANGTVYNIPSGGGGTTVVANPSDPATDDLNTIQIGETVYNIPGGGGSEPTMLSDYHSTNERVVGRWVDGKSLYQLDITGLNITISPNDWRNVLKLSDYFDDNLDFYDVTRMYTTTDNSQRQSQYWSISNGYLRCYSYAVNTSVTALTIKYTKANDAPGTGPTPGNLIYLPTLYSEEEREVGVWIDGKPLYQRTYVLRENNVDKYTKTGYQNNEYQINLTGADKVFIKDFWSKRSDGTYYDTRNCSGEVIVVYNYNAGSVYFYSAHGPTDILVTLMYTKAADLPGSGKYLPDGQYAHHYSTSEKPVGTWIDGSDMYEITVNKGSVAPSGSLVMDRKTMLLYDVLTYLKTQSNSLLYYTNQSDIIWEVKAENYGTDTAWNDLVISGSGGSPSIVQQDGKDTLDIPFGTVGTYVLPDTTGDKTFYSVIRMDSSQVSGDYGGMIGLMYADNQQNTPMFMIRNDGTNTIYRAVYGASWDYNTGKNGLIDHVLVLSIDSTNKIVKFFIDGESMGQAPYYNYGNLRLGSRLNGQSTNVGVKYIGVTNTFDSDDTIINNTKAIVNYYGI